MARGKKRARADGGDASGAPIPAPALTVVEEGSVRCVASSLAASAPGSAPGFFNPKMRVNRDMSVAAVAAAAEFHPPDLFPMRCLDAFASSGVLALRWAAECGAPLRIVVNDASDVCASMADENARAFASAAAGDAAEDPRPENVSLDIPAQNTPDDEDVPQPPPIFPTRDLPGTRSTLAVHRRRADALLHDAGERFHFVHLDPFGSVAPHLDAALARAPHGSILSLTATDTAALYGVYPGVARRRYRAETQPRPPWFRELGVRILVAAIAAAAARHERGVARESSAPPTTNISCRWWCAWSAAGRRRTRASPRTPSGRSGRATRASWTRRAARRRANTLSRSDRDGRVRWETSRF